MIDSHCHLADDAFAADLEATVARARSAGVDGALCILDAGSPEELARSQSLAAIWPEVRFAVGVHPHQAGGWAGRAADAARSVAAALDAVPAARAIGEIGLDFHYDFSPREAQEEILAAQVRLAATRQLPVVVHARLAEARVLEIILSEGEGLVSGVFHCFTGDAATARAVVDAGFHVGVGGIVTFPRADELRAVIRGVPLDRLLVETDSPFLAPVPHRGKRNEPARVANVAEALAGLHQTTRDEIAARTTANFRGLFRP